jgi:dipeptidyl aminopeptidase/acylaminoacyl peptidase
MRSSHSKKYSPKWYQQPVTDLLAQGLQFILATLLALGESMLGGWKNPVALALTVMIPLLVIACHYAAMARVAARQPPHLKEIINELSSIRIPTGKVIPNHANTKLIYLKYTTKDTWAIYLLDIASKNSRLVYEAGGQGESEIATTMNTEILGWSPHDEYFAYDRNGRREIDICDGDSGAVLGKFKVSAATPAKDGKSNATRARPVSTRPVTTSAWLSSRTLLCSDGNQIVGFSPSTNGWTTALFYETPQISVKTNAPALPDPPTVPQISEKPLVKVRPKTPSVSQASIGISGLTLANTPPVGEIKSLAAFGLNSAVWQQSNAIYVRERGRALNIIWQATNCTLIEFSFTLGADKFLLHCKDDAGEFLADYYPRILSGSQDAFTNVVRLDTSEYQPTEAQLINNAKGYAYLNQDPSGSSKLFIKATRYSPPVELPWQDEVRGFSINGLQLYGITANTDEPPGIWKCDLVSGATDLLVSSIDQPFKYAAHAPMEEGYITNATGERLTYYLLQPVKSNDNQKHPLVVGIMGIGELGYTWDRWAQTIANCGGYFVCMDRRKRDPSQWADDAFCAYEFMSKNYAVDTNIVYLLGVSAGAYTADTLLASKPAVWKGAFLFSMVSFPALEQMRVQAIALDVGALDIGKDTNRLFQSQNQLAAEGIRPILMVHPNAGHIVRSIRLERERMEQIAAFIHQP